LVNVLVNTLHLAIQPSCILGHSLHGKSRRGGVIEDQINFEVEQVGRPEEDRLFHIGPAEIMDDLSQGLPGPGVADIMGQLEVFHLGPILITAFGWSQIHAYFYGIYYHKLSMVKL